MPARAVSAHAPRASVARSGRRPVHFIGAAGVRRYGYAAMRHGTACAVAQPRSRTGTLARRADPEVSRISPPAARSLRVSCCSRMLGGHSRCAARAGAHRVPSPRDVLGFEPGDDYTLADFGQLRDVLPAARCRLRPRAGRDRRDVHRRQRDARRRHLVGSEPRAARALPRHRAAARARARRDRRRGARARARGQGDRLDRQRPARERGRDRAARACCSPSAWRPTTAPRCRRSATT